MKELWRAYKYIYYWLYTWQRKLWGEQDAPEYTPIFGLSLSMGCNIGSLAVLIDFVTGVMLIPLGLPKIRVVIVAITLLIIHYFLFVHKGKYKAIEKEFKEESKEERERKGKWVLLYAFGSLAFFIFLIIFGAWLNS